MYTHLLLRIGEIHLKGKNRPFFERKLLSNIKTLTPITSIQNLHGRLIAPFIKKHNLLQNVCGLTSYSPAIKVEKDLEKIKQTTLSLLPKKGTFCVKTKRADKTFPMQSPKISSELGKFIEEKTNLSFSLKNADFTLLLEINKEAAFVYHQIFSCPGGLPTGVEGSVLVLIENQNSIQAGIKLMKRGCAIFPVSFQDQDISELQKYSPQKLTLHHITSFKEVDIYANQKKINILVSGQTFAQFQKYDTSLVVFRPLIAHN